MNLRDWLREAPFTLTMSSGFFGFFAHTGMLAALEESALLPARLTGSSAGGLVAGCWSAGLDAPALRDALLDLQRQDFWDPRPGLGLLRGDRFRALLHTLLPNTTFDACRRPIAVSVFDVLSRSTRTLDSGSLPTALSATCAVPLLFQPVWLHRRPLLDGGILDRPGLHATSPNERILFHHLASRSPWRRKGSQSLAIPVRDGLTTLVIEDLPRSGPHKLDAGRRALHSAYQATQRVLDQPIQRGTVRVSA